MFLNRSITVFDKLYFCFLACLPFIYFKNLVDPVLMPRQLLLSFFLMLVGLCICYKISKKELTADFSFLRMPVFLAWGLLLITVFVSFFKSIVPSESSWVFSRLLVQAVFYILTTYLLIQNQLKASVLIKAIVIFCVTVLIYIITEVIIYALLYPDFFDRMLNITATFGHKNLLAFILFLTIPFLIAASSLQKAWKLIAYAALLLAIIVTWLLQAKAVLGAILLFGLILTCMLLLNKKNIFNKRLIKILTAVVIVIFTGISLYTFANREKFPRLFDKKSSYERLGLWENSKQMIFDNWIMGVGAGNWQIHFPKYGMDKFIVQDVKNGMTTFQRPHNDYLWIASEMGIIGILSYLAIFFFLLGFLIRLNKTGQENPLLYMALLAAVIGYMLIAFVDFPLERIEHQLLLLLIFSIATAHFFALFKKEGASKIILKTPVLLAVFLLPALFSFIVSFNRCKGEYHTRRVYGFQHSENWKQMYIEASAAINSFYMIDPTSIPLEWYSGVALFSSGDINGAKACFEKAYAHSPYNMHVLNNLASSCESLGDHQQAEEFYLKALSISSGFEEARLNLCAVYYNTNRFEQAFETIEKCDIHTSNQKYPIFLAPVLHSWLADLAEKEPDVQLRQKLKSILDNKWDLPTYYTESKKAGKDFKSYLLQQP